MQIPGTLNNKGSFIGPLGINASSFMQRKSRRQINPLASLAIRQGWGAGRLATQLTWTEDWQRNFLSIHSPSQIAHIFVLLLLEFCSRQAPQTISFGNKNLLCSTATPALLLIYFLYSVSTQQTDWSSSSMASAHLLSFFSLAYCGILAFAPYFFPHYPVSTGICTIGFPIVCLELNRLLFPFSPDHFYSLCSFSPGKLITCSIVFHGSCNAVYSYTEESPFSVY